MKSLAATLLLVLMVGCQKRESFPELAAKCRANHRVYHIRCRTASYLRCDGSIRKPGWELVENPVGLYASGQTPEEVADKLLKIADQPLMGEETFDEKGPK